MRRTLVAAVALLLVPVTADAFRDHERPRTISWEERGNRILFETVCQKYPYASIDFRYCRSQALALFKARCNQYRNRIRASRPTDADRAAAEKYCHAASAFSPIR
jgi:hypothetical protein